MSTRTFLLFVTLLPLVAVSACSKPAAPPGRESSQQSRTIRVALVQFDAVPEQPERNLGEMERLTRQAVDAGARWIMFHEGTLTDYTPRLEQLAEQVPDGSACRRMQKLASDLNCFISFGLSERDGDRYYISQVFMGPEGLIHRYRKTWIWHDYEDRGYRDEWVRYDPGTGPELFTIDGVAASCMICADGDSARCLNRIKALNPQIVFYPNNRQNLPELPVFAKRAAAIGTPLLVTNRVGDSWGHPCMGGCVIYDAEGEVLASANREGREEILLYDLLLPND